MANIHRLVVHGVPIGITSIPYINYPEDMKKAIYTTNAIESMNSVIRKAVFLININ